MTNLSKVGVAVTAIYLVSIIFISLANWTDFSELKPNEWGDFLAGAFGPLAIFWLVLGFFQQGHELRHSVKALELQARELQHSVEQQTELVKLTEKQHQLELEERQIAENVRLEEERSKQEREIPFLVLKPDGGGSSGGNHYAKFEFRNRNSDAVKIELAAGHPELTISPTVKVSLLSGEFFKCALNANKSFTSFGSNAILTTKSFANNGKVRLQTFSLNPPDYPMLKQEIINTPSD